MRPIFFFVLFMLLRGYACVHVATCTSLFFSRGLNWLYIKCWHTFSHNKKNMHLHDCTPNCGERAHICTYTNTPNTHIICKGHTRSPIRCWWGGFSCFWLQGLWGLIKQQPCCCCTVALRIKIGCEELTVLVNAHSAVCVCVHWLKCICSHVFASLGFILQFLSRVQGVKKASAHRWRTKRRACFCVFLCLCGRGGGRCLMLNCRCAQRDFHAWCQVQR